VRVLVLGAKGMLGHDLIETLASQNDVAGWDLADLDITRKRETIDKICGFNPRTIVNCAAYTDVDGCEAKREQAFAVNAEGAKNVALASAAVQARLVHLSTDYIFDGTAQKPYTEDAHPNPLNVYGRSKLQGETYIREISRDHLIVRTAWLYGHNGKNFVETILRQAQSGNELRVVNDQKGSPTFTRDLSGAIRDLLSYSESGTFHVTNSGACTWYEFAVEILRLKGLNHVNIHPLSSDDLNRPAKRPPYSILDCSRYERVTGKKVPPWKESLGKYFS
jgi:dTDP-4-dehydrorhamnose reductase